MISLSISNDITKDFKFQQIEEDEMSLAKVLLYSNWSCGSFKDGHRSKANFIEASHIALDFDQGLSLEDAKKRFANHWHVVATTKSHNKDKNGIVCDRFRVLLKLEQTITSAQEFESTYLKLLDWNPEADKQTKDCSRFFYKSVNLSSWKFEGGTIEICEPTADVIKLTRTFTSPTNEDSKRALAYIRAMGQAIEGKGGQGLLFKVCMALYNDFKLSDEEALPLLEAWNQDNTPAWREDELESIYQTRKRYANKDKEGRLLKEEIKVVDSKLESINFSEEEQITSQEYYKILEENKFQIFSEDFKDLYLTYNVSCLFQAASNEGKTSFAIQTAAFCLKTGKKILFLSNQEEKNAIGTLIFELLTSEEQKLYRNNLLIVDHMMNPALSNHDLCVRHIFEYMKYFKPTLVLFDHLNECVTGGSSEPYVFMPKIARQIESTYSKAQKDNIFFPPLITFVQAHPIKQMGKEAKPYEWDMQSSLADSKKMFRCFHVGIHWVRWQNENSIITYMKIGRVRKGYPGKFGTVSKWVIKNNIFVPYIEIEGVNGWKV